MEHHQTEEHEWAPPVNRCSEPSQLKITDIRVAQLDGAPKHCTLLKVYTNQGLVGYGEVLKLARWLEPYNIAWLEDVAPWHYPNQYASIARGTTIPLCTGEDIYLAKNFRPLLKAGGIAVVHPDILTVGGATECKKLGDLCERYGAAMAIHMAESPIACMAAVHAAAAVPHFLALEFHSADVPWWGQLIKGGDQPLIQDGFIKVPDRPGLGIEGLNEELIAAHIHPEHPGLWEETGTWDTEWANDREWS